MEALQLSGRRHHYRSSSAPLSLVRQEENHGAATAPSTARSNDLEMTTYQETKQRREAKALRDEWSTSSNNIARRAIHYKGIREHTKITRFLDAARSYDQELLYLTFQLSGPNMIHFLPADDMEKALSSLRHAKVTLASAGWRVKRCVDLWAIHGSRKSSDTLIWSSKLERAVDTGKMEAEVECQKFWDQTKPRFEPLIQELTSEALRMRLIVHYLDQKREPAFIRELKDGVRGDSSKTPVLSSGLDPNTLLSKPLYEISGALPIDETVKTLNLVEKLRAKLEKTEIYDTLKVDFPTITSQIRYKALATWEKLQRTNDPEASKSRWTAFRQDLDNQPGVPSSGTIILKHKADTKAILAERQLQQSGDRGEAGGSENNTDQTEG
ncbi:hypothetical protein F4804DRAFT_338461 [Jackrogersella minutella]|nr:hypothetical protein F4804DRAFT_338461 [Jackrogersella minutella]